MKLDMRVHQYDTRNGKVVMTKTKHYIMLGSRDSGRFFLQSGRVFNAGGLQVKNIQPWVFDELMKVGKRTREECGFTQEVIERLRSRGQPADPEPVVAAPEPEAITPIAHTITTEEAEELDFPTLKAYANERGLTGRSKEDVVARLTEEGYIQ